MAEKEKEGVSAEQLLKFFEDHTAGKTEQDGDARTAELHAQTEAPATYEGTEPQVQDEFADERAVTAHSSILNGQESIGAPPVQAGLAPEQHVDMPNGQVNDAGDKKKKKKKRKAADADGDDAVRRSPRKKKQRVDDEHVPALDLGPPLYSHPPVLFQESTPDPGLSSALSDLAVLEKGEPDEEYNPSKGSKKAPKKGKSSKTTDGKKAGGAKKGAAKGHATSATGKSASKPPEAGDEPVTTQTAAKKPAGKKPASQTAGKKPRVHMTEKQPRSQAAPQQPEAQSDATRALSARSTKGKKAATFEEEQGDIAGEPVNAVVTGVTG